MIRRLNGRTAHVAVAIVCLFAGGVVWMSGAPRTGLLRRAMWQQVTESLAGETLKVLQAHATLARLVGAVIPATGLGDTFAVILDEMIRLNPDLHAIAVTDDTGRVVLQARRGQSDMGYNADDALQVVRSFAPLPAREVPRDAGHAAGQTMGMQPTPSPVLVRISEASTLPAMVGVGVDFEMPDWRGPGRVTVLTSGVDMPSSHAALGRIWLIGQDDAVIAEPGKPSQPDRAAQATDWTVLRGADAASGVLQMKMADGVHELLYRRLSPWPATLVVDTGRPVRLLTEPYRFVALAFMCLAAFLLWRAPRRSVDRPGADMPLSHSAATTPDRDAMTRRLVAGVAHTFNNVLTILAFDAEMVGVAAAGDDGMQVLSRSMLGATAQGTRLTHHLLFYAERAVLRPVLVDLAVELAQRRDRLLAALDPGQTLVSGLADNERGRLWVRVDPDGLETCLMALLRNAADVTPPRGEITLALEHVRLPGGDIVALVVDDAGPGMDDFTLSHAMDPGFSAQSDGRTDGFSDGRHLGLGLSAARGFARQSGGRLMLQSTPGLGTQARLVLPLVLDVEGAVDTGGNNGRVAGALPLAPSGLSARQVAADRTRPRPKRVLLVEDSVPVRDSIARRLRADGYDVVEAISVPEVLALVGRGVDVIVTDIVLSDAIDGWTLAARAREICPTVPLVFMSGFMSSRQPELLAGDDLASFVRKPVDGSELHTVIAGLLALHETRQMQGAPQAAAPRASQGRA